MPHTSRISYSSKMADLKSQALTLSELLNAANDAVKVQQYELDKYSLSSSLLKNELLRLGRAAKMLSTELNNTRGIFDGSDREITTGLDSRLPELDIVTIVTRASVLVGMTVNRLRSLKKYYDSRQVEADSLRDSLAQSTSPLQTAIWNRREAFVIGPKMTSRENQDLDDNNEIVIEPRYPVDDEDMYDGVDIEDLPEH